MNKAETPVTDDVQGNEALYSSIGKTILYYLQLMGSVLVYEKDGEICLTCNTYDSRGLEDYKDFGIPDDWPKTMRAVGWEWKHFEWCKKVK